VNSDELRHAAVTVVVARPDVALDVVIVGAVDVASGTLVVVSFTDMPKSLHAAAMYVKIGDCCGGAQAYGTSS
jgi:hypothetical protein